MNILNTDRPIKLSVVIPCYNEEKTLKRCVKKVLEIADKNLSLELIIIDDYSNDKSHLIALDLEKNHPEITLLQHDKNYGKGAALRTGFQNVTGDFVAVQDADLEYEPNDLKRLLAPLVSGDADVVFGSRFLSTGFHRVFYFWHYMGNRFLTFLSNMFTDLNLTDMETCYKVFRREVIQSVDIKENRFGFEPEIVAKIAHLRLRIYEMGISYRGRTYSEGKKIGVRDGFRTLYCIFKYNAYHAPLPIQFFFYLFIGGTSAIVNFLVFIFCINNNLNINFAAPISFVVAATVNYILCILILFRHKAQWGSVAEIAMYIFVVAMVGFCDLIITKLLITLTASPELSKLFASAIVLLLNFIGRRFLVFSDNTSGPWRPQDEKKTVN